MAKNQPSLIPYWLILLFQCLAISWDNIIRRGILTLEILVKNGKCFKKAPILSGFTLIQEDRDL